MVNLIWTDLLEKILLLLAALYYLLLTNHCLSLQCINPKSFAIMVV